MLFCQWTLHIILIFLSSSPTSSPLAPSRRAPITGGATAFLDLALAWACLCLTALLAAAARILALPDLLSSGSGTLDGPRGAEAWRASRRRRGARCCCSRPCARTAVVVAKADQTDQVEVVDLARDQKPRKASRGEVADQELRPGGGLHGARSGTRTGAAWGAAGRRRVSPARRCHMRGAGGGVGPCGRDTRADGLGIFA